MIKNKINLDKIGFYSLYNERARNASSDSQMKRCELIITEECNFKCPYCRGLNNKIYGDRQYKRLNFDEIKKIIDLWCYGMPLENIRFSGGEPTLHPDIVNIVKYAKSKQIKRIAISTNGSSNIDLYLELIENGVNDFSISLDACCAANGDKMAGNIIASWDNVISNIDTLSKLTYVTTGIVFTEQNINDVFETIQLSIELGVSDIRVIPAAQYNNKLIDLNGINKTILNKYPILKYRINKLKNGNTIRGLNSKDINKCYLVLDDSTIAGEYHFPCVIYMREGGPPIGKISNKMRVERFAWSRLHNTQNDKICKHNCLDVCRDYNNLYHYYANIRK